MLLNSAINSARDTLIGFGVILAGIPACYLWCAVSGGPATPAGPEERLRDR